MSAGIDMTLGFVADLHGDAVAAQIAEGIEYIRNPYSEEDPFAMP